MSKSTRAIIILGSHRSGTSAVARVVNCLGADLGQSLLGASSDNISGFWEHADIVQLDEWILRLSGSAWDRSCALTEAWKNDQKISIATTVIENILLDDFAHSDLWAVKDPRISCLVPIWLRLLIRNGIKPYFVFVFRHPRAVAASLAHRDNFSLAKSYLIWLRYNIAAIRETGKQQRIFIDYEQLMKNTPDVIHALGQFVAETHNEAIDPKISLEINHFLRPELCHHYAGKVNLELHSAVEHDLDAMSQALYHILQNAFESSTTGTNWEPDDIAQQEITRIEKKIASLADELDIDSDVDMAARAASVLADYFRHNEKNITLVIPTRSRNGVRVPFLKAIHTKLAEKPGWIIILRDPEQCGTDDAEYTRQAHQLGLDILDFRPPFDVSHFSRTSQDNVYVIMQDFHFAYLGELARYAECDILHTDHGMAFLLDFRK